MSFISVQRYILLLVLLLSMSGCAKQASAEQEKPVLQALPAETQYVPPIIYENPVEKEEPLPPSYITFIGDSNFVRMQLSVAAFAEVDKCLAIVGVGVTNYQTYTNGTPTTIQEDLDSLDADELSCAVIMLGTNDWYVDSQSIKESYEDLLDYIRSRNADAAIYVVTIPPVVDQYTSTIKSTDVVKVNAVIGSLDATVIDLNSYLSAEDISSDGYHLTNQGCAKAFDYIMSQLQ